MTIRWRSLSVRWSPRTVTVCLALIAVALGLGVVAMGRGTISLSAGEIVDTLLGREVDSRTHRVVFGIRLPRLLTALGVGAALGTAGAIFQSISRNVLGSPDLIGFTAGAATGAVLQIVWIGGGPLEVGVWTIGGGAITAALVFWLSASRRSGGGYRLVLVGIGVGALMKAVNNLLLTRANLDQALEAEIWLQGSLNGRRWDQAVPVLIALVIVLPLVAGMSRRLDVLEMGDDTAVQLGVAAGRTRLIATALGVVLTAVATAAAGPIAFVALAAPQLVRRLTGATGAHLIASAFLGAALLVAADLLSQNLPFAWSVPVGIATGLLGGIYLLWLLTRKDRP